MAIRPEILLPAQGFHGNEAGQGVPGHDPPHSIAGTHFPGRCEPIVCKRLFWRMVCVVGQQQHDRKCFQFERKNQLLVAVCTASIPLSTCALPWPVEYGFVVTGTITLIFAIAAMPLRVLTIWPAAMPFPLGY